jgi:hypothetical protein
MTFHIEREDLRQNYELERARAVAEGRVPRPRRWVDADLFREQLGRHGQKAAHSFAHMERIAAAPTAPTPREQRASTVIERAERIAVGLPELQRAPILAALRLLKPQKITEKLRAWCELYPGRIAPQHVIAREIGVTRESVTRAITTLRRDREGGPTARRTRAYIVAALLAVGLSLASDANAGGRRKVKDVYVPKPAICPDGGKVELRFLGAAKQISTLATINCGELPKCVVVSAGLKPSQLFTHVDGFPDVAAVIGSFVCP